MHLTAIAIDDEPAHLRTIQRYAAEVPFLDLKAIFTASIESLPMLQTGKIDLIFLDVEMPGRSGIQFKDTFVKEQMVIFTTAHVKYAKVGFDLDIVDFLEKPYSFERFVKACTKAMEQKVLRSNRFMDNETSAALKEPTFIFIATGGYMEEKVMLSDILYIGAKKNNYPEIVLKDNKKLATRNTIGNLLELLPAGKFARVHRSFIVAIDKVEKIGRSEIMIGEEKIPLGSAYEEAVLTVLSQYRQSQ